MVDWQTIVLAEWAHHADIHVMQDTRRKPGSTTSRASHLQTGVVIFIPCAQVTTHRAHDVKVTCTGVIANDVASTSCACVDMRLPSKCFKNWIPQF